MQKIGKFDLKISVLRNGLEKYISFMVNWNLIFIDCIQFTNSILAALVKDLKWNDMDFKYLLQKFSGELLELLK